MKTKTFLQQKTGHLGGNLTVYLEKYLSSLSVGNSFNFDFTTKELTIKDTVNDDETDFVLRLFFLGFFISRSRLIHSLEKRFSTEWDMSESKIQGQKLFNLGSIEKGSSENISQNIFTTKLFSERAESLIFDQGSLLLIDSNELSSRDSLRIYTEIKFDLIDMCEQLSELILFLSDQVEKPSDNHAGLSSYNLEYFTTYGWFGLLSFWDIPLQDYVFSLSSILDYFSNRQGLEIEYLVVLEEGELVRGLIVIDSNDRQFETRIINNSLHFYTIDYNSFINSLDSYDIFINEFIVGGHSINKPNGFNNLKLSKKTINSSHAVLDNLISTIKDDFLKLNSSMDLAKNHDIGSILLLMKDLLVGINYFHCLKEFQERFSEKIFISQDSKYYDQILDNTLTLFIKYSELDDMVIEDQLREIHQEIAERFKSIIK
jgi:hypothetical protein